MNQSVLQAKEAIVKEVVAEFKEANTVVVCEYRGLTVAQLTDLRRLLKKENAKMVVFKNSLVARAVEELGHADFEQLLAGPNAFIFSEDSIAGPRVITKYARRNEALVIKGGLVEGSVVDAKQIQTVAKLPGREGLISMFLSVLQAPIRQFAATVKAVADRKN